MCKISQIPDNIVADLAGQRAVIVADEGPGNEDHHRLGLTTPDLRTVDRHKALFHGLAPLTKLSLDQIRDRATGIYVAPRTRIITGDDHIVRPEQIRVARRMIRDYRGRGNSLRTTISRAQDVDRGEVQYIAPNKPNASVHIDTFHDYELCILAKYLKEIPQFSSELDDAFIEEHGLSVLMQVVRELPPLDTPFVPRDSIVREFVGGSCFQY